MKTKHLFVAFSVIGWSIALAALYQWSQPASNPFGQPSTGIHNPVPAEQMEHSMQYLLPPENHGEVPPQFQKIPYAQHPKPDVIEI